MYKKLFIVAATCAAIHASAQVPVSSTFQIGVSADINQLTNGYQLDTLSASQLGTLNPYSGSLSVQDSDPVNAGHSVTATSAASASWVDAGHGSVAWRNMGWKFDTVTNAEATLNGFVLSAPVWSYTFKADQNGSFHLNYDVRGMGDTFGLLGLQIDWSGVEGGLSLVNVSDPTTSGTFSRPLVAGETYTVGLSNMANVFVNQDPTTRSGHMDADFGWRIQTVPEPTTLVGFAGLVALSLRRKKQ